MNDPVEEETNEKTLQPVNPVHSHNRDNFFVCDKSHADKVSNASNVIKVEKRPIVNTGAGRFIQLEQPLKLNQALEKVKAHLGLNHVRLALAVNATLGNISKSNLS